MSEPLISESTPAEYFMPLVYSALDHQHLYPTEETTFYLVWMLCFFVKPHDSQSQYDYSKEPLAWQLRKALECKSDPEQRRMLKLIGDQSLFISGFLPDSLNRHNNIDYAISMGRYAYGHLVVYHKHLIQHDVFTDLTKNFAEYVDVLAEVSEHTSFRCDTNDLQLYDRWLRTGSKRSALQMIRRGLLPNESLPKGKQKFH